MTIEYPRLNKKTLDRMSREWEKLPRGEGATGVASVAAIATEDGDIAVVIRDGKTQIITEEGMTSDQN